MKSIVEIAESLLNAATHLAERLGTTFRAISEEGLRRLLSEGREREPFRLRRASFRGEGSRPDVEEGRSESVRDMIYEGRGG